MPKKPFIFYELEGVVVSGGGRGSHMKIFELKGEGGEHPKSKKGKGGHFKNKGVGKQNLFCNFAEISNSALKMTKST